MRNSFAISSALAARLLSIIPLVSQCYSATTTTQVQKGDSFWHIAQEHGVTAESLEAANPGISTFNLYVGQTINVPVPNDVPAIDDTVTTLVFASVSQTAKTATPSASVTSSNDVPAMSDFVTGSIMFASGSQPAKAATLTTLVTSSRPSASSPAAPSLPITSRS